MDNDKIGIIGGSGVYSLLSDYKNETELINTPFGDINFTKINYKGKEIYFIPRHGKAHSIPPHMINFKANIYAFFKLGIKKILATNAVGSLKTNLKPGEFVVLDQFIDLVSGPVTFFDGEFEVDTKDLKKKGVVHTDVTSPYNESLRNALISSLKEFPNEIFHEFGCYVMFRGPRFESKAEINMVKNFGDVVGMTGAPEIILARELDLQYASLNLITNFGAGLVNNTVNHEEVVELFENKIKIIQKVLFRAIELI